MTEAAHLLAAPTVDLPVVAVPAPGRATSVVPEPTLPATTRRSWARLIVAVTMPLLAAAAFAAGTTLVGDQHSRDIPATPPSSIVPATPAEPSTCAARYQVLKSWTGGFPALVTVRNTGHAVIAGRTVHWANPAGLKVDDLWDGRLVETGAASSVENAGWNATLKSGESTTFGFTALVRGGNQGARSLIVAPPSNKPPD